MSEPIIKKPSLIRIKKRQLNEIWPEKNSSSSTTKVCQSVSLAKTPHLYVRNIMLNDAMRQNKQIDLITLSAKLVVTKWQSYKKTNIQQSMFVRAKNESEAAITASCLVSELIAQNSKSFSDGYL